MIGRGLSRGEPSRGGRHEARELAHGVIGSARVTAFGVSNVAPAGAVVGGLVIVVAYAGFAAPLVVLIALVASLCCAISIAEFARRLPSAGSLYTYNSRGLGRTGGFLTGWMLVFAYALYVPAGIALTSAYASQLLAATLQVNIRGWALFLVILAAAVLVAYLGIRTSSWVYLVLAAGEVTVIAALAITILIKIGPAHYSAGRSLAGIIADRPAHRRHQCDDLRHHRLRRLRGRRRARRGGQARTPLHPRKHDRHRHRDGLVLPACRVRRGVRPGRHNIPSLARQPNPLGYLTSRYWSPSALWAIDLVVVLTGLGFVTAAVSALIRVLFAMGRERILPPPLARLSSHRTPVVAIGCVAVLTLVLGLPLTYTYGGARTFGYLAGAAGLSVVLVYLAVNISSIRAFRTRFRDEFRLWRHLLVPATATVCFLFPLWEILHPRGRTLMDLLPFAALGWLGVGAVAAAVLRARRPASFEMLGRVFIPAEDDQQVP